MNSYGTISFLFDKSSMPGMYAAEAAQYCAGELCRDYLNLPCVKASAKDREKLGMSAEEQHKGELGA